MFSKIDQDSPKRCLPNGFKKPSKTIRSHPVAHDDELMILSGAALLDIQEEVPVLTGKNIGRDGIPQNYALQEASMSHLKRP